MTTRGLVLGRVVQRIPPRRPPADVTFGLQRGAKGG
jgi:hypothetical protein